MHSLNFRGGGAGEVGWAWVDLPLGPRPAELDDCAQHVDVQLRTQDQRRALRRLSLGLDLAGERTADGKRVGNNVEAILWLLERINHARTDRHAEEEDRQEEGPGQKSANAPQP